MFYRKTKEINSQFEAISSLEEVQIGGFKQSILIRGENTNNPLMLFLHGGPGTAQIGLAPKFQRDLEKHFTVVNWDQRGAGLSYSRDLKKEDLTIENMVKDTVELIQYLLKRFNQPKLFLVGHSWGSVLGVLTSQKAPEFIYGYIGIGQVVNMREGEKISYDYTINKAKESNHKKALKKLEEIEYNPYDMKYLGVQRKWLAKFGGSFIGVTMYNLVYSNILFAPEYTMKDWFVFIKGGKFSLDSLWEQLMNINFIETAPKLEVPVYIFAGRHDYQVPSIVAEQYFHTLECPHKEWIWFENSGHLLNYEEVEKFNEECLKIKERTLTPVR
ncbi:alpha/beta hydrolase [Neobacillus cucumis]|uniref:alpha/beta fold hydrolase n=1 Tax=Neobacillus cucumis TaxID=1740721 RepID=UPI0018E05F7E|nr:alpha/beta hydrolase [Neobacillus cucumis]MBI0580016.1 alpha/beta hydrolase [Neobacillus cucumis]